MKRLPIYILILLMLFAVPAWGEEVAEGAAEEVAQEEVVEPTDPVAIIIKGTLPGTNSIEGSALVQKGLDLAPLAEVDVHGDKAAWELPGTGHRDGIVGLRRHASPRLALESSADLSGGAHRRQGFSRH